MDDMEHLPRRSVDSRGGATQPVVASQEQGTQPTRAASPRTQEDSLAGSFTSDSPRPRLVNRMGEGPGAPLSLNAHAVSNDHRRAPVKEYVEVGAVHQAAPQLPPSGEPEAS